MKIQGELVAHGHERERAEQRGLTQAKNLAVEERRLLLVARGHDRVIELHGHCFDSCGKGFRRESDSPPGPIKRDRRDGATPSHAYRREPQ